MKEYIDRILWAFCLIVTLMVLSSIAEASHVFNPNRNVDLKNRFNLTGVVNGSFQAIDINGIEVCQEDGTNCPPGLIDTNETVRFIELTAVNCAGTDKVIGVFVNGTVECGSDVGAGAVSNETDLIVFTNNTQNITVKTGYPTQLDGLTNLTRMERITFLFSGFLRAISGGWLETERLNATLELTVAGVNVCQQDGTNCQAQVVDTNETIRFIELVTVNCPVNELMRGVFTNGTVDCVTDQTGAAIVDTNETIRFGNLTALDCPVGQTVNGVHTNGTVACIDDIDTNAFDGNVSSICADGETLLGEDTTLCINFNGTVDARDTNESSRVDNAAGFTCPGGDFVNTFDGSLNPACGTPSGSVDTNETVRMLNLTGFDCPAGSLVIGVELNGTVLCAIDDTGSSIVDTNETIFVLNLTDTDCPAGFLVIGVENNGTLLCAADADTNTFDGNASSACANGEVLLGEDTTLCVSLNNTIDDRYINGSGLSLEDVGDFLQFNHSDTSTQLDSDNSGNTFIQDIILDTFGHITSIVVALVEITNIFNQDLNVTSNVTFNNITANEFFAGNGTFIKSLDCNNIVGQDSDFCIDADTNTFDGNVSSICANGETLLGEDTTLCINFNSTVDDRDVSGNLSQADVEGIIYRPGVNITGSWTVNATQDINITKGVAGLFLNDSCTEIRGLTSIIRAC